MANQIRPGPGIKFASSSNKHMAQKQVMYSTSECVPPPPPTQLGFYVYASTPKSLLARPKYRSGLNKPKTTSDFYNIMWDPHVHRGETFRTFQKVEKERFKAIANAKSRAKRVKKLPAHNFSRRLGGIEIPKTPPPYGGRAKVATERFLEEISEIVEETDATTQTDDMNAKPPPPIYVVAKLGYDQTTEMAIDDLYDFEEEVEPIVETMADKILEQSILEVMEEEELVDLRQQQNEFESRRRIEQLEQHLECVREQALFAEQDKLIEKYIKEIKDEKELEDRICTMQFSKAYLLYLVPRLLENLTDEGLITSAHLGEIIETVKPWLNDQVVEEIEKRIMSKDMLDEMIQAVVDKREADVAAAIALMNRNQNEFDRYFLNPEYDQEE